MKKCYLSGSECSKNISREHFISKNILSFIYENGGGLIGGMDWQPSRTLQSIGIDSLVTRNLCEKHNNYLSYLDEHAGKFFRRLYNIDRNPFLIKYNSLFFGQNIERWLLKIICGLVSDKKNIPDYFLDLLRDENKCWPEGCGLYVLNNDEIIINKEFSMQIFYNEKNGLIVGGKFTVCGVFFVLWLSDEIIFYDKNAEYRPRGLIFNSGGLERRIEFMWSFYSNKSVIFSKLGVCNAEPKHHEGWSVGK